MYERGVSVFRRRHFAVSLNLVLAALLALCVMRLWLMPLPSSFWVDEMGTAFVVRHGAADPSLRAVPQVPESIYYVLPRISEHFFGLSETAYRLPSVLALAFALWLIARIAATLIHPEAAWFAAFGCLSLHGFNYQAADARPYALGTCVACASLWFLIRWLDSARTRDAVLFVVAASVLWRVHLTYWPLYAVFTIYTLTRLIAKDTPVGGLHAGAAFTVLGVTLVPVLKDALALYHQAGAHVVVSPPTFADLSNSLKLGVITGACAGAAALNRWLRWPRVELTPGWAPFTLIFSWWVCVPLGLFAFSWLTGNSVFVARYLFVALPGAALMATVVAAAFVPQQFWKPVAAALGLGVLLFLGGWDHLWPPHHNSDWRLAAQRLNAESLGDDAPVLCPSPFIEARPPVWQPGYLMSNFLYAPLAVYRIQGHTYPFPFESSPEAQAFAARLSEQTLSSSERFALYGGDQAVRFWCGWLSARPELEAWRSRRLGPFGDVDVVVFEKAHAAAHLGAGTALR